MREAVSKNLSVEFAVVFTFAVTFTVCGKNNLTITDECYTGIMKPS
jgi:hypothetical protein